MTTSVHEVRFGEVRGDGSIAGGDRVRWKSAQPALYPVRVLKSELYGKVLVARELEIHDEAFRSRVFSWVVL